MENLVMLKLIDECDDSTYPVLVKKDKNFEKKYEKLLKLCRSYENFQEIEDFLCDNFDIVNIEEREIEY